MQRDKKIAIIYQISYATNLYINNPRVDPSKLHGYYYKYNVIVNKISLNILRWMSSLVALGRADQQPWALLVLQTMMFGIGAYSS